MLFRRRTLVRSKVSERKSSTRSNGDRIVYSTRGDSIGLNEASTLKVIARLNQGLPFRCIAYFQKSTSLPLEKIAEAVRIPSRTLSRRKAEGRLQPDESERLLRVSTVFEEAVDLFDGDRAAALQWLQAPQKALGGETPLNFARTEVGAGEVRDLIGRLEHGVFT